MKGVLVMNKEQLIKKIDIFMNQARQANCYFSIIKQFAENKTNYYEEMSLSSAFYSYTYNALVVATFMELSKIYDSHHHSSNIQKLVKECRDNIAYFPTVNHQEDVNIDGEIYTLTFPFKHTVTEDEKEFFQEEIEHEQPFQKIFNDIDLPIHVEMTIERYFELYEWRLSKLHEKIKNLLKQRNKVYAHNDEATMKVDLDSVINNFPLDYKDINDLIVFALDFSIFAGAMLTGVNRASEPVNIDDWENTLRAVKLGEKYKDVEIQKQVEEFKKNF